MRGATAAVRTTSSSSSPGSRLEQDGLRRVVAYELLREGRKYHGECAPQQRMAVVDFQVHPPFLLPLSFPPPGPPFLIEAIVSSPNLPNAWLRAVAPQSLS